MPHPKPTKRLKEGMLVTYKRGWIVPCGNGDAPVGVWREASSGMILTVYGEYHSFHTPRGIQISGDCSVKAGKKS